MPVITYSILHQARKDVRREEYVRSVRQLHERVRDESEKIAHVLQLQNGEAFTKSVELIKSQLRPFLHTPIKSDEDDVRRVISEGLEQLSGFGLRGIQIGSKWSAEGAFVPISSNSKLRLGKLKRMVKGGRQYFASLGFRVERSAGRIYESTFVVEGGFNLDVLEHIIRDRLGIYSATHGQHLLEFENVIFASYNLVFIRGKLVTHSSRSLEIVIYFSKPTDVRYEPFRSALSTVIHRFHDELRAVHSSIWQRKLGLGTGTEYVVRVRTAGGTKRLPAVAKWLSNIRTEKFIKQSLLDGGKLALKEYLFE